ncbi:MAG: cupredoxin domain-containing protein [Candidatus Limnocylindrales bacterium]
MKKLIASALIILAVAACGSAGSSAPPAASAAASPAASAVASPAASPAGEASAAPSPAGEASAAPSPAGDATAVIVKDFTLDPLDVAVAGTVSLAVTNDGPTVHNVAIRDDAGAVLGTTADLKAGASETLTVEIPAGSYILFCSLPGHESLGIKGTLTVSE